MKKIVLAVVTVGFIISGCAKRPEDIGPTYVSPLQYDQYSCDQLSAEAARLSARAAEISGVQQKKATGDAVAVGVSLILFWPALFFIKGNGATEAEVGRLKGEMEAVERAAVQKSCGIQFQRS